MIILPIIIVVLLAYCVSFIVFEDKGKRWILANKLSVSFIMGFLLALLLVMLTETNEETEIHKETNTEIWTER